MKKMHKICKGFIALMLCLTSAFSMGITSFATSDNLALNKPVVASAEYPTLPASNLTDSDEDSRWSSENDATQWAYVDLGQELEMNKFQMIWESDTVYSQDYNIYVSNSTTEWGEAVVVRTDNNSKRSEDLLGQAVKGRYVKLEITKVKGYPSVSCRDFKVLNTDEKYQNPAENVALNKTAVASSIEANSVKAANAVDGDNSSRSSRWGSNLGNGPDWIYVDLGDVYDVNVVKVFWENRKATSYQIQITDELSNPMKETDWTTVKSFNNRPSTTSDKIVLDQVYQARYVRLLIDSHTVEDPDGGQAYNTVSIYELEIYGGNPDTKPSISEVVNSITVATPDAGDDKLQVNLPAIEGYDVIYNGTDFEQVVGADLTIYQPIVDKEVNVSFKVTNQETGDYKFKEIKVVIPGKFEAKNSDNQAPAVLPELAEWKGESGNFTTLKNSKIVIADERLNDVAKALKDDYEDMTGNKLTIVNGSLDDVNKGDFYFSLTSDQSKGLQDEGYLMEITDKVNVSAYTTTGAYWATRTILQSLKQTESIPCGTTRDYPLYELRGFILDVGRKAFTMDYLQQVVKQMSWYKMNDFQVHLNDNLIGLENVVDPMSAYSAFRLESDVKKGGNNGLNQQDLTSTDLYYTKEEFKNFIKESRTYGVDIVPEIDTPAHSLALTKVRPDLRHGTTGRNNDHLALATKYDECLAFVQDIFDEYMTTSDPVFDDETIVHVGADEYNADKEAYRKFADDMLEYVQDTNRTARIWGSLSQCRGTTPVRSENVQMNLWNFGYANMDEMYEQGYDLINCNDGNYYVVPNAGYYYDYLYDNTLYNLDINSIGGVTIPAGDKQMIGGAFAVWNDMTDYIENGVSEFDVYDRIENAIPLFGAKLWGKGSSDLTTANSTRSTLGDAPRTNFNYDVASVNDDIVNYTMDSLSDSSANKYDLTAGKNASLVTVDGKQALQLNGGESYVMTPLDTVGLQNDLRIKVKRTSASSEEQILLESNYGTIKAVQKETGKVGFSRENHDYSFDYQLPVNEWVELELKNVHNVTSLYVNGKLIDVLGDGEKVESRPLLATTMIPFNKIGSASNAFVGYVDDLRLGKRAEFSSTMELDYAVMTANILLATNQNKELKNLVDQANALFKEYNPSSSTIATLVEQITTIIENTEYQKADYSRVNQYLGLVPDDLSYFSDASVAQLNNVIASIRQDLPAAYQDTVDGYEKLLASTLSGLELKSQVNVNYVDNSKLSATASSYQPGSEPYKALDSNESTMWHSNWSITTLPHWIALKINEPTAINGLTYVPRQSGSNGNVTEYRIETSDDGDTWSTIKTGTLSNDSSTKVIEFDTVTTTNLRLVYVKAINNNGSAAEIKVHSANVTIDLDGLNAAIKKAEAIKNDGYSETSWNNLQAQITAAKQLAASSDADANAVELAKRSLVAATVALTLNDKVNVNKESLEVLVATASKITDEDLKDVVDSAVAEFKAALKEATTILNDPKATQVNVDLAYERLSKAMEALDTFVGDKTMLEAMVNKVTALSKDDYIITTWDSLQVALQKAQKVLSNSNATQLEIDEAYDELVRAFLALRLKPNKDLLNDLINHAEQLVALNYTTDSWQVLQASLKSAKEIIANDEASELQINQAYRTMQEAIANLVPTKKVVLDQTTLTTNDKVGATRTDDTTVIILPVLGMLLAATGLFVTRKRKSIR